MLYLDVHINTGMWKHFQNHAVCDTLLRKINQLGAISAANYEMKRHWTQRWNGRTRGKEKHLTLFAIITFHPLWIWGFRCNYFKLWLITVSVISNSELHEYGFIVNGSCSVYLPWFTMTGNEHQWFAIQYNCRTSPWNSGCCTLCMTQFDEIVFGRMKLIYLYPVSEQEYTHTWNNWFCADTFVHP